MRKNLYNILIFIIILIIGLLLLFFNRINLNYHGSLSRIMNVQFFGLLSILIVIILLSFHKINNSKTLKYIYILSIFLISSELYLTYQSYKIIKRTTLSKKYDNKNCETLKKMFYEDLKNNEIVFFTYGLAIDPEKIEREIYEEYKINVTVIGKGCLVIGKNCYNETFFEYFKSKSDINLKKE